MKKFLIILFSLFLCVDGVNAALRAQNSATQSTSRQSTTRQKTDTNSNRSVTSRNASSNTVTRKATARTASNKIVTTRGEKQTVRSATTQSSRLARAATSVKTRTFGANYNSCRDAYFTCMDQFCATQNETYRRCVCSSKLNNIQKQEKLLSQTAENLQDFQDLNIDMISKTSNEVKAMLSATEGEKAVKKDTSESANTLKNISGVLSNTKSQSLSTQGKLDIAGDIKSIWSTTNLIGGADIANLTGEALFNAVHAQCSELVEQTCAASDLKMVASAYGMYIENDCSLLENNLKNKTTNANAAIRSTRHKMQDARLENYDAHNSSSINDCIANVRKDITADSVCGNGYVHCLDFSGKYLNISTGEPIYSPEFYQIENQLSLSGDVLKNSKNTSFVNALNKKRNFATKTLDLCRDVADDVWDEFMRQSIVEIYQAQQARVKTVKDECLQVVNECYLKQSDQLKNFSDIDKKINLGQTLELSEEMCADKLNTCSNLYGGGEEGLQTLLATMSGITDATIEQSCSDLLVTFAKNICAVPVNDSAHSYPYGCRKYAPGESRYARNETCNKNTINPFSKTDILISLVSVQQNITPYTNYCSVDYARKYISCNTGYYLYNKNSCKKSYDDLEGNEFCYDSVAATECRICPANAICIGGTAKPSNQNSDLYNSCGEYYIGSLYQQFVRYAIQNCTRPSKTDYTISESLLSDVDKVMKTVRAQLVSSLSTECSNQSGTWVDIPWTDKNSDGIHDTTGDYLLNNFYVITGANALWGYCKQ